MNRFRALIVAGALIAVPGLSACEPNQVGSAAVVGGERITVSQLQDLTQNLLDAGGGQSLQQGEALVAAAGAPHGVSNDSGAPLVLLVLVSPPPPHA